VGRLLLVLAAGLLLVPAVAVAAAPVVPLSVQRSIAEKVQPRFRWVPTLAPAGWRYRAWGPGDPPRRGTGLDIWFSPAGSTEIGPGFHVLPVTSCSLKTAMKRFTFDGVRVGWSTTYEDSQAWTCLSRRLEVVVSDTGTGGDAAAVVAKRARAIARMAASARAL
jgi:hypothetical protein